MKKIALLLVLLTVPGLLLCSAFGCGRKGTDQEPLSPESQRIQKERREGH
jgi:hypothetical protein